MDCVVFFCLRLLNWVYFFKWGMSGIAVLPLLGSMRRLSLDRGLLGGRIRAKNIQSSCGRLSRTVRVLKESKRRSQPPLVASELSPGNSAKQKGNGGRTKRFVQYVRTLPCFKYSCSAGKRMSQTAGELFFISSMGHQIMWLDLRPDKLYPN